MHHTLTAALFTAAQAPPADARLRTRAQHTQALHLAVKEDETSLSVTILTTLLHPEALSERREKDQYHDFTYM